MQNRVLEISNGRKQSALVARQIEGENTKDHNDNHKSAHLDHYSNRFLKRLMSGTV